MKVILGIPDDDGYRQVGIRWVNFRGVVQTKAVNQKKDESLKMATSRALFEKEKAETEFAEQIILKRAK